MNVKIVDTPEKKVLTSSNYNFVFNKKDGKFFRWGKTKEEDPECGLPEIADIEISTICSGVGRSCDFCYKSNTKNGINMTLDTFKKVFAKLPKSITQIAFGIGDIDANPDLWDIMQYCRDSDVVPNITINGAKMTDEYFNNLANLCGAVAVSLYDEDMTFNSVKKLTDLGMTQVNMHVLLCEENYEKIKKLFVSVKNDPRLEKLNAVVLLSLKKKGRGIKYNRIEDIKFKEIVDYVLTNKISVGFDSCTCPKWLDAIKEHPNYNYFEMLSEPCESSCFSVYLDVSGQMYPCSFSEGAEGWKTGIDIVKCEDFIRDVWMHPRTIEFRQKLLNNKNDNGCRMCPLYEI